MDSCHVEQRAAGPKSRHLDITAHSPLQYIPAVRSQRRTNVWVQSFARGGCGLPAQSAESAGCHVERRSQPRSRNISTWRNILRCESHGFTPVRPSGFLDCACGFARNDNHFFCHLERSVSGVERSRVRRTCTGANHNGSRHFTVETPRLRSGWQKNGGKKSFRRPLYCLLLFGRIIHRSEKFP